MSAFTENEVADLISNCPYIIVLSASSSKTQKSIVDWCGKFQVRKKTWNNAEKGISSSISYEDQDIVSPSDLMTLQNTGEAILISPYGYFRIQKTPWYKDMYFKPKVLSNIKHNEQIMKIKEEQ